jgi:hypothetical protein
VAFLSHLPLQDPVQLHPFPQGLAPVQVGDPPAGSTAPPSLDHMGRGALQVTVTADGQGLVIITAHLKSKLLTFPNDRFQPHDEDEHARFGAYALDLRAAEAVTLLHRGSSVQHTAGCGSGGHHMARVNSLTRHVQVELEDDADSSCAILLVPTSVIAPLLSLGPKHG